MITQSYLTDLTYRITGACIEVHKILGPALLESVYQKALKEEFNLRGIKFIAELTDRSCIQRTKSGLFVSVRFFD